MSFRKISLALLGLVAGAGVSGAYAATIHDTTLTEPPGVYFGQGNQNSGFTVDQSNGVETGLSAITRYIGPITPVGNVYTVPTGATAVAGKTGSAWGFVFSVNTDYLGGSGYTLANTTSILSMTDAVTGSTGSFNLSLIPDNAIFGSTAFQNSETLSFAAIAAALGDPGFNEWIADTYTFTLTTTANVGGATLSSDTIVVNAVPEPLTISLFAAGLVGAGALRRRKKTQA